MKKQMRKIDVLAVAVGSIIGWGCFVMPGNSFLPSAGPIGTVIGLFLAAVMAWVIAQSYGYLIRKYPVEGGEFEYATQAFGKRHAFICGWWLILAYISSFCTQLFVGPASFSYVVHMTVLFSSLATSLASVL